MNLPFLSMADDKEEFREQFCHKYAGNDSVDIEDIDEVKNVYQTFWKNAFEMTINRNLLVKIDECISKFQDKTEVYSPEILEMIESFLGNLVGKDDK